MTIYRWAWQRKKPNENKNKGFNSLSFCSSNNRCLLYLDENYFQKQVNPLLRTNLGLSKLNGSSERQFQIATMAEFVI